MLKDLQQKDFALTIVEDSGMEFATATSKVKVRFAKFMCECGNTFRANVKDI